VRYDPIGKTVNLDANNADIRQIVPRLMNAASITRYSMDRTLDAKVTLTLRNKPFNLALQTVLARAGAESDYDNGLLRIYRVGERPEPGRSPGGPPPSVFRTPVTLRMTDQPLSTVMVNLSRITGVAVRASSQAVRDLRVSMTATNDPLWAVLQRIAQQNQLRVAVTGEREATFSPRSEGGSGGGGGSHDRISCRNCRYELQREWRFCPMCGERTR
jgi:hypothetical protein